MTSGKSILSGSKTEWLSEIAKSIQLREGVEGVIRALWTLYGGKVHSTRDWSAALQIPVPVLAAMRRELERRSILETGPKLRLTETGAATLNALFGEQERLDQTCAVCQGTGRFLPPEAMPVLEEFRAYCDQRPQADVTLDQSHATPETGISKALLLLERGLLARPIFLMGDDDLISIACYLVRKRFIPKADKLGVLAVADIDSRYLELIDKASQREIQVREYDVRNDFPDDWREKFAVALTDPAYTENGITAFSYRCCNALEESGTLLLSMPFPEAPSLSAIQKNLLEMGFAVREILPGFNRYHGASLHASRTNLIIGEKIYLPPEKSFSLRYTPLYTGEVRLPGSIYACTMCETRYKVGPGTNFLTIQDLKKSSCGECGNEVFRRLSAWDIENSNDAPLTQ